MTKNQTCPYCGHVEEPNNSIWDEEGDSHHCTNRLCGRKYYVRPQYQFLGFEVDKYCNKCEEFEEHGACYCDDEDPREVVEGLALEGLV
ncbi:hypothetical protein [Sporosarcina sp. FSL K6-2383]|uniref:hypothetical protein n=1 Tax=Sporosarcina sp. FSL K6-2383 TaxID=2921556 RepID=UPI00315A07B7